MDFREGAFDKTKMVDLFTSMVENLCSYSQSMAGASLQIIRRFAENFHIADLVDEISDKLGEHPVLRFLAVATALSCAIPVVVFLAFGLVSVVVTFTGFLLVEGIVLAVGGLCMVMCLVAMIMVMSVLAVMLGMSYFLTVRFMVLFKNYQSSSRLMRHLRPAVMNNGGHDISNSIDDVHRD